MYCAIDIVDEQEFERLELKRVLYINISPHCFTYILLLFSYKYDGWYTKQNHPHSTKVNTCNGICKIVKKIDVQNIVKARIFLSMGPFHWHGLTLILASIINYIHNKVWDENTYPFPNFNGDTFEVWEWIDNVISQFTWSMYPYGDSN